MFLLKNHKYLQQQWKLQKKFKTNFLYKVLIINNPFYLKLSIITNLFVSFSKIYILTKSSVKIDFFKYRILKVNKKKLSIKVEEIIDKFILNINIKTINLII